MAARLGGRQMRGGLAMLFALALTGACSPASPVVALDAPATTIEPKAPSPVAAAEASLTASGLSVAATEAAIRTGSSLAAAAASNFVVRTVLAADRPLEAGDYLWDTEGAPEGERRIVIDIEAKRLYLYRGGVEIGRAHIIYGHDDKPTPTGSFTILEKKEDHVSNLYDAPMPYMLRLTMDGVAIHGSEVDDRYATHGCVGVPDEFAELLFAEAKLGDRVLITNGWMTDTYAGDPQTS
ncbi:MAG TPA: L,D-transpeptidase family protein [Allosphingosinicella sp.]|nr:L,D-transpeptidase family protein [Allosphingosinicella sp.]